MLDKIQSWITALQQPWNLIQQFFSVSGGLYVDAFAVVMLVRLLAVLKGYPALTPSEAGLWAGTIAAFAYSNGGPKPL